MGDFDHDEDFVSGDTVDALELDHVEVRYRALLDEVLADGVITADERSRLDREAQSLGIDRQRVHSLENALVHVHEERRGRRVLDLSSMFRDTAPTMPPPAPATARATPYTMASPPSADASLLRARVAELEARVVELERELDEARAQLDIDVDLDAGAPLAGDEGVAELQRRLRRDVRDREVLSALYRAHIEPDRRWCIAQVLEHLGAADEEQRRCYVRHRTSGLIQPRAALDPEAWQKLLPHPEEDEALGELLGAVVSPVLVSRAAAARAAGKQAPGERLDPQSSTVQAVRCVGWVAQILNSTVPAVFADKTFEGTAELVLDVPPALRLGRGLLSGREPVELAFVLGRRLAYFRRERFLRLLVPSVAELNDLFLAALAVGKPSLPLPAEARDRVRPLADAIAPVLEPADLDRLRAALARLSEDGGHVNLQRWAWATDRTAARVGLLVCGKLDAAARMLELDSPSAARELTDDLILFAASDRYAELRKRIGIAVDLVVDGAVDQTMPSA